MKKLKRNQDKINYEKDAEQVIIPSGIEIIPFKQFRSNRNLKHVVFQLPSKLHTIDKSAFLKCSNLCELLLPEGLLSIDACAFKFCTALTTVQFPSTLWDIQEEAFSLCTSIRALTLPDNIHYIGKEAFRSCTQRSCPMLPSKLQYMGERIFGDSVRLLPALTQQIRKESCQLERINLQHEFKTGSIDLNQNMELLLEVLELSNTLHTLYLGANELGVPEIQRVIETLPRKPNLKNVVFTPCNVRTLEWTQTLIDNQTRIRQLVVGPYAIPPFTAPVKWDQYDSFMLVAEKNPELFFFGDLEDPPKELRHLLDMNRFGRVLLHKHEGILPIPHSIWAIVFERIFHVLNEDISIRLGERDSRVLNVYYHLLLGCPAVLPFLKV